MIQISKSNKKKSKNKGSKTGRRSGKSLIENNYDIQDVMPKDYNSEFHPKENIYNIKKKAKEELEKKKNLDNFELNNLDYDEACELDHRGFCKTYWSVLMREHSPLITFLAWNDYNLFYIKIQRFFILFCVDMTMNGLFFVPSPSAKAAVFVALMVTLAAGMVNEYWPFLSFSSCSVPSL